MADLDIALSGVKKALDIGVKIENVLEYIDTQRKNAEVQYAPGGGACACTTVYAEQADRYTELGNLKGILEEIINSDASVEATVSRILYRVR